MTEEVDEIVANDINYFDNKAIDICSGSQYGCCPDGSTSKIDAIGTNCNFPKRQFDQVVRGDVYITPKKNNKNQFKIVFNRISDFLLYQVWSGETPNLNKNRKVSNMNARDWVSITFPNPPINSSSFQPTCVMELDIGNRFVFVLTNAKVKNDKVVFTVSVKEIDLVNSTSNLTIIPRGTFLNVRFDIDSTTVPPIVPNGSKIVSITYQTASPLTGILTFTPPNSTTNNELHFNRLNLPVIYPTVDSIVYGTDTLTLPPLTKYCLLFTDPTLPQFCYYDDSSYIS